jgi:hypothetical protein
MNLSIGLQTPDVFKQCVLSSRFSEREGDVDVMEKFTQACLFLTKRRGLDQRHSNVQRDAIR